MEIGSNLAWTIVLVAYGVYLAFCKWVDRNKDNGDTN